jgi:RNA-directed DNA polymerase
MRGKVEMIKSTVKLQELRKKIYEQAKAEKEHRFWGLYVHVCKLETITQAYAQAKANNGAAGIDGVTFEQIEAECKDQFLLSIQQALITGTYRPQRNRKVEIPKGNGKTRMLSIPSISDRVVQGALNLIIEPIFEADFQEGSFGYRPKRSAHEAVNRVERAMEQGMTRVIDLDLSGYFDSVRHHILLEKLAKRIDDDQVMGLLNMILKAGGKKGVPQGGTISTLLSNIYLNEVDKMLEKAKAVTRNGDYIHMEYARFADDLVILVNWRPQYDWLWKGLNQRLREELNKLEVKVNEDKTRTVDLMNGSSFTFLGFEMRMVKTLNGKHRADIKPSVKARTKLLNSLKEVFRRYRSQPMTRVRDKINPIIRGWVNYFRTGQSSKAFKYLEHWLNLKIRRHLMYAMNRGGFGWKRWSTIGLFAMYNIYRDFKLIRWKARPAR